MMICNHCFSVFPEPAKQDDSYEDAFGTVRRVRSVCPDCGSDELCEAEKCKNPGCGEWRNESVRLCRYCQAALLKRVQDFFDTLTAEEEEQVDCWLETACVQERKKWEVDNGGD